MNKYLIKRLEKIEIHAKEIEKEDISSEYYLCVCRVPVTDTLPEYAQLSLEKRLENLYQAENYMREKGYLDWEAYKDSPEHYKKARDKLLKRMGKVL